MSIQFDIADVLAEVGLSFTIERMGVPLPDVVEYLTYTPNSQVTKPFVREHFLEVAFKSETQVASGDVITFVASGASYLVMNNTSDFFEDEIIRYLAVLYKTNVLLTIQRPQNTTQGYDTVFAFQDRHVHVQALVYAPLFGNVGEVNDTIGTYGKQKQELYLCSEYGVLANDRIVIEDTGEIFTVDAVIARRFPKVSVVNLTEDTRG